MDSLDARIERLLDQLEAATTQMEVDRIENKLKVLRDQRDLVSQT